MPNEETIMSHKQEHLRVAVGRALRELRRQGCLSLDDVERSTRDAGIRVTRSHLSRVETGQVDIGVPRFISLVRVLGEPPRDAIETLETVISSMNEIAPRSRDSLHSLISKKEWQAAARLLRRSLQRSAPGDRRDDQMLLARCEVALGRWRAAERIHRGLFRDLDEKHLCEALCSAVTSSAIGVHGMALAFLGAAKRFDPLRTTLLRASCLIRLQRFEEAENLLMPERNSPSTRGDLRALWMLLSSEIERLSGRARDAARSGAAAIDHADNPVIRIEAEVMLARAEQTPKRALAALKMLGKSLRRARELGIPDLLARVHDARAVAFRALAAHGDAAKARRSARNIRRRAEADREYFEEHPCHALYEICRPRR